MKEVQPEAAFLGVAAHNTFVETLRNFSTEEIYSQQAKRTPRLLAEQEVFLAQRIEAGVFAEELLGEGEDQQLRRKEKAMDDYETNETQLVEDLKELVLEGKRAQTHMLAANQGLVMKSAHVFMAKYQPTHMKFLDLVQEGNLGLIRAMEKFDYTKGYKFSTYASDWIKQTIARGLGGTTVTGGDRMIHWPKNFEAQLRGINNALDEFVQAKGRAPSSLELAVKTKMTVEQLKTIRDIEHKTSVLALDQKTGEAELADYVRASADTPDITVERSLMLGAVGRCLDNLDETERLVIESLYGFGGDAPQSESKIASSKRLKPSQVAEARRTAEQKLRYLAGAAGLQDFLEL